MKKTHFLILLGIIFIYTGCRKSNTLSGTGNSFTYPFYEALLDNFYADTGIKVVYNKASSNMSIRALYNQTIDFMPTFYLPDNVGPEYHNKLMFIPCMASAIVVAYNLPGAESLNLDAEAINAIYTGRIKYWNDPLIQRLNPGVELMQTSITALYRTDDSGSSIILSDYLKKAGFGVGTNNMGEGTRLIVEGIGIKRDESIAANILDIEGAIGFLGMEHAALQNLYTARIRNSSGNYIEADTYSISRAIDGVSGANEYVISNSPVSDAYPLSTFCGIIIYKNQKYNNRNKEKQESLVTFLRYVLSPDIQQKAALMGYVPLPEPMRNEANELVDSIEYTDNE